jgi:8-oxo-dGTP pyrophosphatase MutT (NUDIX family)
MSDSCSKKIGVAVVIESPRGWLVIKRAQGLVAPGYWCFPGGGVEPGEDQADAVIREMHEELGVDVVPERALGSWFRSDAGLELVWWEAKLKNPDAPVRPNPLEVAEFRWVDRETFIALSPALESNTRFLELIDAEQQSG